MEQRVQQADDPIIVELEARYASLAYQGRLGKIGQKAGVDGGRQQIGLRGEGAVMGRRQLLAQRR